MKLKSITLHFETFETIEIDGKHIGGFVVDDFSTTIRKYSDDSVGKTHRAGTFAVEIDKDADTEYKHQFAMPKMSIFERLDQCRDISGLSFVLEDTKTGEIEDNFYYLTWSWAEDGSFVNEAQTNYRSKAGNYYIVVKDGAIIDDFFGVLEAEEYRELEAMGDEAGEKLIVDINAMQDVLKDKMPKELYEELDSYIGGKAKVRMLDRLAKDARKADKQDLAEAYDSVREQILKRCCSPKEIERYRNGEWPK